MRLCYMYAGAVSWWFLLLTRSLAGNTLEMWPIISFTFTNFHGLYFWSMSASNFGVLVHGIGFGKYAAAKAWQ